MGESSPVGILLLRDNDTSRVLELSISGSAGVKQFTTKTRRRSLFCHLFRRRLGKDEQQNELV
jgi:hypothetical protein